jgi:hypothetical protein
MREMDAADGQQLRDNPQTVVPCQTPAPAIDSPAGGCDRGLAVLGFDRRAPDDARVPRLCQLAGRENRVLDRHRAELYGDGDIAFGDEFSEVGEGCFFRGRLLSLCLPQSVRVLGKHSFALCEVVTQIQFLGRSRLRALKEASFLGCRLQSLVVPRSVECLGKRCFWGSHIESLTFAADSELTKLEEQCFALCSLTAACFPRRLQSLPKLCFEAATLGSLTFEPGSQLTVIEDMCFRNCIARSIGIPSSVKTFRKCSFKHATIELLDFERRSRLERSCPECPASSVANPPRIWQLTGTDVFIRHFEDDMIRRRRRTQLQMTRVTKECPATVGRRSPRPAEWDDNMISVWNDVLGTNQKLFPERGARDCIELIRNFVGGVTLLPSNGANSLTGIIAHLTRECRGNVADRGVVAVTSSFSGAIAGRCIGAAKNAADLETNSASISDFRWRPEDIPHTRNNMICYEFRRVWVYPTHYAIRSWCKAGPNGPHLKNWCVETSMDGKVWRQIDSREDNSDLNDQDVTRTFDVANYEMCRFVRLVNIGKNHRGNDCLCLSALEIFGCLVSQPRLRSCRR